MELRPLGSTGLQVSVLGLGTVKLGRNTGVKYPGGDGFSLPTDEQATQLLRSAADFGINLIDTAPAYGTSEERLGSLMAANNWFGGRGRWILCTKAGEEFDAASATSHYDFSPAAIRASVERSLQRLRVSYIDVLLLHSDGRDQDILNRSGSLEELHALKQAGILRAVGISTKTLEGGQLAVNRGCDVVMIALSPADTACLPVVEAARRANVGILIKKALASGHTSDAAKALRFVTAQSGVTCTIVGTTSPDHLRANAAALTCTRP